MNIAAELIERTLSNDCEISVKNNKLHIKNGQSLPGGLKEELSKNRSEILSSLNRDRQAKGGGFQIGISGQLYCRTVSFRSTAYIELIDGKWDVWRETYQKGRSEAVNTKVIAQGTSFSDALGKAQRYFNYMAKMQWIA